MSNQGNEINIEKILFIDIETVPQYSSLENVPENLKKFWVQKAEKINKDKSAEELYERAGIYAEFGKIVCIGLGYIRYSDQKFNVRIKSIYGDDEKQILTDFFNIVKQYFNTDEHYLCAHNGKEFDFPYIARRAIVNRLELPSILSTAGTKPWEVKHIDTMELWKFGDHKSYTSLDLLANIFGLPSPKDDISGKDVYRVYYEEKNLEKIAEYCKKDVLTLIKVYLRYRNLDNIELNVEFVE